MKAANLNDHYNNKQVSNYLNQAGVDRRNAIESQNDQINALFNKLLQRDKKK